MCVNYMGSKAKIADQICPIIQRFIDSTSTKTYIEPFVGGANVIDKIRCNRRIGSDTNRYLIELLKHAQSKCEFPDKITYEQYCSVRKEFNRDNCFGSLEDWYIGAVGFLASFNGRFFDGGYAKDCWSDGQYREYYKEHLRNLLSQNLSGIDFYWRDYDYYSNSEYTGCVFYCDPPYAETKNYNMKFKFDTNEFFDFARNMSKNNIVLISEQDAPDDFNCIWAQDVQRQINTSDKFMQTEKMFIHSSLHDRYDIDKIMHYGKERKLF